MLKSLEPKVLEIVKDGNKSVDDRLGEICELLRSNVAHYDWVGFYFKNGDKVTIVSLTPTNALS